MPSRYTISFLTFRGHRHLSVFLFPSSPAFSSPLPYSNPDLLQSPFLAHPVLLALQHLLGRGLAPPLQLQDAGLELMALLVQGGLTVLQPLQNLPVFLLQFPQVRLLLLPQEAMNVLEVSPDFLSPIRYLLLESRQDAQQVGATQRPPRDE